MNKKQRENIPILILMGIIAIFFLSFVDSETTLIKKNKDSNSFEDALDKQLSSDALHLKLQEGTTRKATPEEIEVAMELPEEDRHYQFLALTEPVETSAEELDGILEGKGILEGQGGAFMEAQSKYGVNALYLISHAQLETGNGRSQLAQGQELEGTRYYNFFGIGAFDFEAVEAGTSYAVRARWNEPEKAILGGAQFIKNNYLDKGQKTLYAMRWNPESPGNHLYASDIEWASKIGNIMKGHYRRLGLEGHNFIQDYYAE
ncbi:N-acetylglucosaminidase [Salinicoccus sp. CNSTN-B1]